MIRWFVSIRANHNLIFYSSFLDFFFAIFLLNFWMFFTVFNKLGSFNLYLLRNFLKSSWVLANISSLTMSVICFFLIDIISIHNSSVIGSTHKGKGGIAPMTIIVIITKNPCIRAMEVSWKILYLKFIKCFSKFIPKWGWFYHNDWFISRYLKILV